MKIAIGLLILTGAVIIWLQFQTQKDLREENESLQQQIAQLKKDEENLSNRLADANDSKKLPDEQFNELLK
jgi:cell division septum initiation protein DivIVA